MGLCASLLKASTKTSDTQGKMEANVMAAEPPIIGSSYSYENIIKSADPPLDCSSTDKLYDQLHSGVYLEQKKKKYWIDKDSGLNCFMVFPRALAITWGGDERYWRWHSYTEQDGVQVEMAELIQVCWVEVYGKLDKSHLSPNTVYEVVSTLKLENEASGWEVPVIIGVDPVGVDPINPDYTRKVSLVTKPRGQWFELQIGEYSTSSAETGNVRFFLHEYRGGQWKKGLVIKGFVIRPKKQV